jgi:protoporphyrinogen oxidase
VRLETTVLISTVPLDVLHGLITLESDGCESPRFDLRWRSLRLLYLITRDKIPSEYETFYFPEPNILFGRVSEVNKYSPVLNANPDYTALTIEIPCSYKDEIWNMDDAMLAERCIEQLQALKILNTPAVGEFDFFSKRVKTVYPVYDLGWRRRFDRLYQRLNVLENLYMIGRSALFLHCNIDHCMLMAIRLAQHLSEAHPTKEAWAATEKDFFNYRVRE